MKILVVGGGAREHTLVWKLARSPRVREIYSAPGNAGTAGIARNLAIDPTDIEGLLTAVRKEGVELVVVGPEAPLAAGIADRLQDAGIPVFGASKAAAEIESSKVFAKALMQKYSIPCARSASFSEYQLAKDYVKSQHPPIVVKADGLAAGKGVTIADSVPEALRALPGLMEGNALGGAGSRVVIEEYLPGREMSAFAFTDGNNVVPMVPACDYKRALDGDRGPNTGGMGGYSPPYFYTPALGKRVMETIMAPVVRALFSEGRLYRGVLYGGLMIADGEPKVLEFNARFGDPEAQVTLPRLKTDLIDIMLAIIEGKLDKVEIDWSGDACVGVVLASGGYPGSYKTGFAVSGLGDVDKDVMVFHAGTRLEGGKVVTSGGRVLTVAALGKTVAEAREKVYGNLPRIRFEGCYYRRDIAFFEEGECRS